MTTTPRVALITYPALPDLSTDDQPLLRELMRRGIDATAVVWSDATVAWERMDLVVLRSAWDAIHHYAAFLAWVDKVAAQTVLWNSASLIRWNSHKGYLLDLAAQGIPIVPTVLVPQGSAISLANVLNEHGWTDAVVKPAISSSAFGTFLVQPTTLTQGQHHLAVLLATRDMLIQPYFSAVADDGERALVFIEGVFSHAGRKIPAITPEEPAGRDTVTRERVDVAPDEFALAERVLSVVRQPTLYARVDMVRDSTGTPALMELEVIDPTLYFRFASEAVARFADAIVAHLKG